MKKKILALISILCSIGMTLSLFGCGAVNAHNPSDEQNTQLDTKSENTLIEHAEQKEIHTTPVTLSRAEPFSEGIAWVRYKTQDGDEQSGWLHKDGHIDQPFPADMVSQLRKNNWYCSGLGSIFSGGYSYLNTGDAFSRGASETPDLFLIFNQNGEITAQSPDDGYSYEILCGGDGVYLVKQSIRSMTEKEDRYGIISGDGRWIYECSLCEAGGTHPLSLNFAPDGFNQEDIDFSYLGSGIFKALYHNGYTVNDSRYRRYGVALYNAFTNKSYILDTSDTASANTQGSFSAGWILVLKDEDVFLLSTDFELIPIAVDTTDTVIYSEGVIFAANCHIGGNRHTRLTEGKFYRPDGSVLADLSQYELLYEDAYELYRYSDGYAAVVVSGVGGGYYLGILDSTGSFAFDPVKIEKASNVDLIGTLSCGVIPVQPAEIYATRLLTVSGEEVGADVVGMYTINTLAFSDGYAVFEKDDQYMYIDVNGNLLNPVLVN